MIGLDTNILVRYLTKDDPEQAEKVIRFIAKQLAEQETFFINRIVLCELIWVLESAYKYPKASIIDVMEKILTTKQFEVEGSEVVWGALSDYRLSKADFSDLLIGRQNKALDCSITVTLDKGLKKISGFEVL